VTPEDSGQALTAGTPPPEVLVDPKFGSPKPASMHRIAAGPGGFLAIGDGDRDRILVVDVASVLAQGPGPVDVPDLYSSLADALGIAAADVVVLDLTFEPLTQNVLIAASDSEMSESVLVAVQADASLSEVVLDDVAWLAAQYPQIGGEGAYINDLVWAGDHLVAASTEWTWTDYQVVTVSLPLAPNDEVVGSSTRTYHRTHTAWETMAPVTTLFAVEEQGSWSVGASYQCAPVVRFGLGDLALGEEETLGVTPFDYGGGRQAMDFEVLSDGEDQWVLGAVFGMNGGESTADRTAGTRVKIKRFLATGSVDEEAPVVFDRLGDADHATAEREPDLDRVWRMAKVDDTTLVVVDDAGLRVVQP
jgi:hypothetical protein